MTDAAQLHPPVAINPACSLFGEAEARDDVPLLDLPAEPTSMIHRTLTAPATSRDLASMRVRSLPAPYWERTLPVPPEQVVPLPVVSRLPRDLDMAVDIDFVPESRWHGQLIEVRFTTAVDRRIAIDVDTLTGELPAAAPGQDAAALVAMLPDGSAAADARRLRRGQRDVALVTILRRERPDRTALHFALSDEQVTALAGPLWSRPTVGICAPAAVPHPVWRSGVGHSLDELLRRRRPPRCSHPGSTSTTLAICCRSAPDASSRTSTGSKTWPSVPASRFP
ncbi:MAG TPA: hypothetical protein VI248_08445 [Kineosporiaceae bacterium]